LTPERIDAAKARAKREGVSVELRRGDATRLHTRRMFDAVLALYILFLLPDDDDVKHCLRSIHKLLLPGGVLITNIFNPFSASKNFITETLREGVSVEESKAPGIFNLSITKLHKFDRINGVAWINESNVIEAPDGVHLFRNNKERVRLFTHSDILSYLNECGFKELRTYADWEMKQPKNPKAEEVVFVARK
jgi:2-polyprenyl-3-methyl-5-hydroxy-6-metoxy-1,4-benzoquinol methylase